MKKLDIENVTTLSTDGKMLHNSSLLESVSSDIWALGWNFLISLNAGEANKMLPIPKNLSINTRFRGLDPMFFDCRFLKTIQLIGNATLRITAPRIESIFLRKCRFTKMYQPFNVVRGGKQVVSSGRTSA